MRDRERIFHLAIPCDDLDAALAFYVDMLGCRLARRYPDRITLDFFGDQVVCHLSPADVEGSPRPYPRHFGMTFRDRSAFESLAGRLVERGARLVEPPRSRFEGRPEEHLTFFVADPSNNVLEFKWYYDPGMMY